MTLVFSAGHWRCLVIAAWIGWLWPLQSIAQVTGGSDGDAAIDPAMTAAQTDQNTDLDPATEAPADAAAADQQPTLSRIDLPPPRNIAIFQQIKTDIQRVLEPDRYETALVGEDEVLLVINQADTAIVRGVAVIVAEAGQNSLNNYALASLVKPLNGYGWVTILLPAPSVGLEGVMNVSPVLANPPSAPVTTAAEPVQPYSHGEHISDAGFLAHQRRMQQLMTAAVGYSSQYPGFFLVIAKGTSAAWLSSIYAEPKVDQPDALVAIAVNWPDQKYNKSIPQLIATTPAPVLDISSQWDSGWTIKTARQRAIAARRSLKLHYRQREVIGQPSDPNTVIQIAKEIHGWLTHMGW